jgi:hypothetical protein
MLRISSAGAAQAANRAPCAFSRNVAEVSQDSPRHFANVELPIGKSGRLTAKYRSDNPPKLKRAALASGPFYFCAIVETSLPDSAVEGLFRS